MSDLYIRGLGWTVLGRFEDHEGFDGIMVGDPRECFHLEFTFCRSHPVEPSPTEEDLLVLYFADRTEWEKRCMDLEVAGFARVNSLNPYWERLGRTYVDPDGYRIVVQNAPWP